MSLQPYVEPIGVSPEVHRKSRRWVTLAVLTGVTLLAGLAAALWRTGALQLPLL